MDPDKTLRTAQLAARRVLNDGISEEDARQLAEAFDALDTWLRDGGFLPEQWQRNPAHDR
jgi:hypothetical protein